MILSALLFVIATTTAAPDASIFVGPPQGQQLAGATLDTKTQEVASLIRCPVCQGLSIADSPSEMAVNMKHQVRELLSRGYTQEQILDYFERSYGQFVLLKPKFQGVNALVWLLPLAIVAIGAGIVVSKMKKLEKAPLVIPSAPSASLRAGSEREESRSSVRRTESPDSSLSSQLGMTGETDPYLENVRRLVGEKS